MPRPVLTLITAAAPGRLQHFAQTCDSVREAVAAAEACGWDLRWHVTVDGPDEHGPVALPEGCPADRVLHLPRSFGAGAARTHALAGLDQDGASWVYPLDADDVIDAEALVEVLGDAALADPAIGWVATSRRMLDGEKLAYTFAGRRRWERWELVDRWVSPGSFHANSVLVRTGLVLAVGGWPALASYEDLGFLHTVSDLAAGTAVPADLTRYRVWASQSIQAPWWAGQREASQEVLVRAANARRVLAGRPVEVVAPPAPARGWAGMPLRP